MPAKKTLVLIALFAIASAMLAVLYSTETQSPLDSIVESIACSSTSSGPCIVKGLRVYRFSASLAPSEELLDLASHFSKANTLYVPVAVGVEGPVSIVRAEAYCDVEELGEQRVLDTSSGWLVAVEIPFTSRSVESLGNCHRLRLVLYTDKSLPQECSSGVCVEENMVRVYLSPPSLKASIEPSECSLESCTYTARIEVGDAVLVLPKQLSLTIKAGNRYTIDTGVELVKVYGGKPVRHPTATIFLPGKYELIFNGPSRGTLDALRYALNNKTSLYVCLGHYCDRLLHHVLVREITPWFFEGAYSVYEGTMTVTGLVVTLYNAYPIYSTTPVKMVLSVTRIENDYALVKRSIQAKLRISIAGIESIDVADQGVLKLDFLKGYRAENAEYVGKETVIVNGVARKALVYQTIGEKRDGSVKQTTVITLYLDEEYRWPLKLAVEIKIKGPLFYVKGKAVLKLVETNIPGLS